MVGTSRTRKSTDRVRRTAAPTPTTPHLKITVATIAMKKTRIEITEAGRFFDISSVATLAIAEMELTIPGQMLSTMSAEANLYPALASPSTQKRMPAVARVAKPICKDNVRI